MHRVHSRCVHYGICSIKRDLRSRWSKETNRIFCKWHMQTVKKKKKDFGRLSLKNLLGNVGVYTTTLRNRFWRLIQFSGDPLRFNDLTQGNKFISQIFKFRRGDIVFWKKILKLCSLNELLDPFNINFLLNWSTKWICNFTCLFGAFHFNKKLFLFLLHCIFLFFLSQFEKSVFADLKNGKADNSLNLTYGFEARLLKRTRTNVIIFVFLLYVSLQLMA